jgi:sigma-B regulation protein RsbU (phosphoserine phosphatase)
MVLGAMEGIDYEEGSFILEPGEGLFLYTDGVTEAVNIQGDFFSVEGLQAELSPISGKPLKEILSILMERIHEFSGEALQADDITMMVLQYKGKLGGS